MDVEDVVDEDVYCDKLRMNQILLNLLSNAIKYTPQGGKVSVRLIQHDTAPKGYGDYEIRVRDNGIGMSEQFAKRIFDAFEREKNSTVSGIQGTGLGMAITKRIVDLMGGTIDLTTAPGEGSEFVVRLRLRVQNAASVRSIPNLEGVHALVVDDDQDTCESMAKMLQILGMRSQWSLSGREAISLVRQAHEADDAYGVVVVDLKMPDMDGIAAARGIQDASGGECPILMITAYDWQPIKGKASEAGVDGFCTKPVFLSELHDALLKVLDGTQGATSATDAGAEKKTVDLSGYHALLVEDMMVNREVAKMILGAYGITLEEACDGREAVDKVAAAEPGHYDVVLMDIQMPVMNGYEAARAIRALEGPQSEVPIVAMTANAFDEDRQRAHDAGMNGHVAKPIDPEVLVSTLSELLVRRS